MEFSFQFQNLSHFKAKPIVFLMGLIVIIHLASQSLVLPYGNALRSLMSNSNEDTDLKFIGVERIATDGIILDVKDPGEQASERSNNSMENVTVVADNIAMESGINGEGVQLLKEESESLHLEKSVPENNHSSSGDKLELMETQVSIGNGSHETDSESQPSTSGHEHLPTEEISVNDSESSIAKDSEITTSEDEAELPHDNLDTERNTSTVMRNDMLPNSVVTVGRMNEILAGYIKSLLSM